MLDPATITVLPIRREQLASVPLRCWPSEQSEIDALFDTQETIGMAAWEGATCVASLHCYRIDADGGAPLWPEHNNWWAGGWREWVPAGEMPLPAWCLACYHVGRTLDSDAGDDEPDPAYMNRGIGTKLLMCALDWATGGDYAAVVAPGAPPEIPGFAEWMGHMPRSIYEKMAFDVLAVEPTIPAWAQGACPPEIAMQVQAYVANRGKLLDLRERLMAWRV